MVTLAGGLGYDQIPPGRDITQKLTQNLKNEKMAITWPLGLKSKNKTTLFPSILKVGGNKVVLFFDMRSRGRVMAVFSFFRF